VSKTGPVLHRPFVSRMSLRARPLGKCPVSAKWQVPAGDRIALNAIAAIFAEPLRTTVPDESDSAMDNLPKLLDLTIGFGMVKAVWQGLSHAVCNFLDLRRT